VYRIRFHGRGGQGMKTASRILSRAFFLQGFEVQDAPRYGAERRGAPIFAYVRAAHSSIKERGIIQQPDLVVVADDSLVAIPAAGVLAGFVPHTVLLIYSNSDALTWQHRLNLSNKILVIPTEKDIESSLERVYAGASCAGAAAQLTGQINRETLELAIKQEFGDFSASIIEENIQHSLSAFDLKQADKGCVLEGRSVSADEYLKPEWIQLPFENAQYAAPAIHAAATSELSPTGLWRTTRPIIEYDKCNQCWWVCSSFCPDGAIQVTDNRYPRIDYDHCKGCMVCVTQCPPHAIIAVPEVSAAEQEIQEPPQ